MVSAVRRGEKAGPDRVCNGNIIGSKANNGSYFHSKDGHIQLDVNMLRWPTVFLVHIMNSYRAVARVADAAQP